MCTHVNASRSVLHWRPGLSDATDRNHCEALEARRLLIGRHESVRLSEFSVDVGLCVAFNPTRDAYGKARPGRDDTRCFTDRKQIK